MSLSNPLSKPSDNGIIPVMIHDWMQENNICPDCGLPAAKNPKKPSPFGKSAKFGVGEFSVCYNAPSVSNGYRVNTCAPKPNPDSVYDYKVWRLLQ